MLDDTSKAWAYTKETMQWLNKRFATTDESGRYFSHEPIYGFSGGPSEPDRLSRLSRTYQILQIVNKLDFESYVDVGGAEGYWSNIISRLFQVPCLTCDLSYRANSMAKLLYGLDGVTVDVHNVPIRDQAFDLVMCSETIEHLVSPARAVRELLRVAKKYVMITTPLARSEKERDKYLGSSDQNQPHRHLHYFTKQDLLELLGEDIFAKGLRSIPIHPLLLQLDKASSKRPELVTEGLIESVLRLDSVLSRVFQGHSIDILIVKGLNAQAVRDLSAKEGKLDIAGILRFLVRENRIPPAKVAKWLREKDEKRILRMKGN